MSDTNDTQDAPVLEVSEEQRAEWDAALEKASETIRGEVITLQHLLGLPVPYKKYPGLLISKPKLGHRMEIARRYRAITKQVVDEEIDPEKGLELNADLFAPFAHIEEGGTLRQATREDLLFRFFDTEKDFIEFIDEVTGEKKDEGDGPNE